MRQTPLIIKIGLFIFVLLYFSLPASCPVNFYLLWIIEGLYTLSLYAYFKFKKKVNYFDFDTIFIFVNSIIILLIPISYGSDNFSSLVGISYSNIDMYLTKGTILAAIGMVAYMYGSTITSQKELTIRINLKPQSEKIFYILFWVTAVYFIILGGLDYYKAMYNSDAAVVLENQTMFQMLSLSTVLSNVYCSIIFFKKKVFSKADYFSFLAIVGFCVALALVGNRTIFSLIVLPYIFCFFCYKKPLSLLKTSTILLVGSVLMYIIQIIRQGRTDFTREFAVIFSDFTFPGVNNFVAIEYVAKNGFNWGSTFFYSAVSVIPGLGTFLGTGLVGSADIFTSYVRKTSIGEIGGMGSTCISDIYISFGIWGVIILMYFLGYLINNLNRENLAGRVFECGMFTSCIFMCRATYLLPVRYIIWGIAFIYIINMIKTSR